MIFDSYRNYWMRKEIKKSISNRDSRQISWPQNILILYRYDEMPDLPSTIKWSDTLHVKSANIEFLAYRSNLKKDEEQHRVWLNPQSFLRSGGFKDEEIKRIAKKRFDLLVNYYDNINLELKFMSHIVDAVHKVGISDTSSKINDITIEIAVTKADVFAEELKKYLTLLTKK